MTRDKDVLTQNFNSALIRFIQRPLRITQNVFSNIRPAYVLLFILVFLTAGFQDCANSGRATDSELHQAGIPGQDDLARVNAIAVDPRTGNLFVGGNFTSVADVVARNIAFFNKNTDRWSDLPEQGLNGPVNALLIIGDDLYVGGQFTATDSGATTLTNIARYSITTGTWSPLNGILIGGPVHALAISGNNLYVGGSFAVQTGPFTYTNNIIRYNLTNNTLLPLMGNGLGPPVASLSVNALAISGDNLYVGGNFTRTFDGTTTNLNNIARYDLMADTWSSLAENGLDIAFFNAVNALAISGNSLYVGGHFTSTFDGTTTNLNKIARYDLMTNTWSPLTGSGLDSHFPLNEVNELAISGNSLYVGGNFTRTFDGTTTNLNSIAQYNMTNGTWLPLANGGLNGDVYALTVTNNSLLVGNNILYVGGDFRRSFDGISTSLNGIARYPVTIASAVSAKEGGTITSWEPLGFTNGQALNGIVNAIAADASGNIYTGGEFTKTADETTNLNFIARYDPATSTWSPLAGNGLNGQVHALAISGDNLYVGGSFTGTFDGTMTNLNNIARYNLTTNTWSSLTDDGLDLAVNALAISGNTLFVGGDFTQTFNGATVDLNHIARYDTAANVWSAISFTGLNNTVNALLILGDDLYGGGSFSGTNTVLLSRIGRYNIPTDTWFQLADEGLNAPVNSLGLHDNFLYVNGTFTGTYGGGTSLDRLARYDPVNNQWSAVTGGADLYASAVAGKKMLRVGNDLYIAGSFTSIGDTVAYYFTRIYLQRWNVPASDSDWFNNANWATGAAPATNTNAVIPPGALNIDITSADVTLDDLIVNSGTLTIGTGRTLTINGTLVLEGGIITGEGTLVIAKCQPEGIMGVGGSATSYISTALVRCVNDTGTFNFPVGTANAYSPITVKAVTGTGNVSIKANQGAYSNPAAGLPANRLARWWQIENPGGGVTEADVYFNYLQSDLTGTESIYKAYRISGGTASTNGSSVNTFSNIVYAPNVAGFSDWTLAESAPTAASVSVSGRVRTANGRGLRGAVVSLTDSNGLTRRAISSSFGYYRFDDVEVGRTYIVSVRSKRFIFADPTRILNLQDEVTDFDFTAESGTRGFPRLLRNP